MYTQQNVDEGLNSNFKLLIKELNSYNRTVERIHIEGNKWVFYIDPLCNGNNTIEIKYMNDPRKELDAAIKQIRSIREFEDIRDKNLDAKSRILSTFRQKYDASMKTRSDFLRKIYRGKPRKTPDDFYEFYQGLIDLATSNFVSPDQLKQTIKMYEKRTPNEIIILPHVGKYGKVNLDDIQTIYRSPYAPKKLPSELPMGSARERVVRKNLRMEVALKEALDKKRVERKIFTQELIERLEENLVFGEEFKPDELGEDNLNSPE